MSHRLPPLLAALLLAASALRAGWPTTDSFGYQAAAAAQPWTDISGSGTAIPNAAFSGGPDDGSVQVNLPFNFSFYGSIFTKTYLRPNGFVQFSNPDSVFDPFTCPLNSLGQKGIVAGYWMDLDLTNSGVVYTQVTGSSPNRQLIIQYTDVPPHGGGAGTVTFQIQLGEDNSIVFSYNDSGTLGSGNVAVAGITSFFDCPNRDSLTLSCDQPNLVSGLCLRISYPAVEPACGTPTFTASPSDSPTITVSPTRSYTASPSPSATVTATQTDTFTASPTFSDSPTPTGSPTITDTWTSTATDSPSPTATDSPTDSFTPSPTPTDTPTPTDSVTGSPTATDTWTPSDTSTVTDTFTASPTDSPSFTASPTYTDSFTASPSYTASPSFTDSPTDSFTASPTPTFSDSPTTSFTASPTFSDSPSPTFTATPTSSFTASPTFSDSPSPTFTASPTSTDTASPTVTPTFTATATLFPAAPLPACLVLGQTDFGQAGSALPPTAGSLNAPAGIAWDTRATPYKVYIADSSNHRVLLWRNAGALALGQPADGVIGQAGFAGNAANRGGGSTAGSLSNPQGLAVDPTNGDLWVADSGNHRVLRFKAAQLAATGTAAAEVLGQGGSFFSALPNQGGLGAASLESPTALSFDPFGRLAVADSGNHRVLRFSNPDLVSVADAVWGQASFTANSPDHGASVDNAGFDTPQGLLLAPGELWVADSGNHRVLHFNNNPILSGSADLVLGQPDFGGHSANQGFVLANQGTLNSPRGLAYDAANRLLVADSGNHRVLGFEPPYANAAAKVWGQVGSLGSAIPGCGQDRMDGPRAIAASGASLAVADTLNNRALFYGCGAAIPVATPTATFTASPTRTPSFTPSATRTPSFTASPSYTASPTFTASPTASLSLTPSLTATLTPSLSATPSFTQTNSYTASPTASHSPTASPTPTRTMTFTVLPSVTPYPLAYGKVIAWPNPIPRDAGGVNLGVPPQADAVSLDVYDRLAQPVAHLQLSAGQAGLGWVRWDLRNSQGTLVAPGLYFLRAQGKGMVWMGKVTVR